MLEKSNLELFQGSLKAKGSLVRFLASFASDKGLSKRALTEYKTFCNHIRNAYGDEREVKIRKDINSVCRHFACGHPKISLSFGGIWFKVNKSSGIPTKLKSLQKFLETEPNIALVIPNSVYDLRVEPDPATNTVTDPATSSLTSKDIKEFEKFCKRTAVRLSPSETGVNISLKGGPNGPSAITQVQDLIAVHLIDFGKWDYPSMVETIYGPNSWLSECYSNLTRSILNEDLTGKLAWPNRDPSILAAKMEFIPGPAGKTRIIYILNWWVQSLLLPLHDSLMNHFRKMKGDCTWNQSRGVELIRAWSARGDKLYSFDLTAATDRWPVSHQAVAITAVFGEDIGNIWHYLMTRIPPYDRVSKKFVPYSVGQPMGAYSSWAALNYSHHMVVRFLAWKFKVPCKYMVLGDDIVINGERLAEAYRAYMNRLGVSINSSKSITHEEGKPSSAEFARNLVKDGAIVGTVSPNLLTQIFEHGENHMLVELLREVRVKFGKETFVSTDAILLPVAFGRLLSRKQKDDLIRTLSIPVDYGQPVTFIQSVWEVEGYNPKDYIELPNPWKGKDKVAIQNVINMKYIEEAKVKLKELEALYDNLSQRDKSTASGYMLSHEHHPIAYLLKSLKQELSQQAMKVAFMHPREKVVPQLITTSIDFLIAVITEGKTYKKWRQSKTTKLKKISSFIKRVHKDAPDEWIAPNPGVQGWGDVSW